MTVNGLISDTRPFTVDRATMLRRSSQRTQNIRHVAEFPDNLGVAEIARGGITGAAECDRTEVARDMR